jgi:hypothetical protein
MQQELKAQILKKSIKSKSKSRSIDGVLSDEDDQEINFDNYQKNLDDEDRRRCFIIRKPYHELLLIQPED